MFDEDNEKRFPRISLGQFIRGVISFLFLTTSWLTGLGREIWSFVVLELWANHLEAVFGGNERNPHDKRRSSKAIEKGSQSEP